MLNKLNPSGIYGYVYGKYVSEAALSKEGQIIFIKSKELKPYPNAKQQTGWLYDWSFPGMGHNTYMFQDYKKTWAFSQNDLLNGGTI